MAKKRRAQAVGMNNDGQAGRCVDRQHDALRFAEEDGGVTIAEGGC